MRGTQEFGLIIEIINRSIPAHAGNTCQGSWPRGAGRSIPAHAGNTQPEKSFLDRIPVHPRACGNTLAFGPDGGTPGPSPRMRGTLRPCLAVPAVLVHPRDAGTRPGKTWGRTSHGSIPAHAGNTGPRRSSPSRRSVHPRHAGNIKPKFYYILVPGPSPRMRGTQG